MMAGRSLASRTRSISWEERPTLRGSAADLNGFEGVQPPSDPIPNVERAGTDRSSQEEQGGSSRPTRMGSSLGAVFHPRASPRRLSPSPHPEALPRPPIERRSSRGTERTRRNHSTRRRTLTRSATRRTARFLGFATSFGPQLKGRQKGRSSEHLVPLLIIPRVRSGPHLVSTRLKSEADFSLLLSSVLAQLKTPYPLHPFPLPGLKEMPFLSPEQLKDVLCATAMYLLIREQWGGIGKKKDATRR